MNEINIQEILNEVKSVGTISPWLRGMSLMLITITECQKDKNKIKTTKDISEVYERVACELSAVNRVKVATIKSYAAIEIGNNMNNYYKIVSSILTNKSDKYMFVALLAEELKHVLYMANNIHHAEITIPELYIQLCKLFNISVPQYGYTLSVDKLSYITHGICKGRYIESSREGGKKMDLTLDIKSAKGYGIKTLITESRRYYNSNGEVLYMIPNMIS